MFTRSRVPKLLLPGFQQRDLQERIDEAPAVKGGVTALSAELPEVAMRARRRIAARLLPFVFLMYVVNYIDRVNVSFANLRMSADLGFSDRVFGLGVGMFYLGYVLFEIPGAIIVERWSARKWIARIMISWGALTILTGFVHSATQFYAARFFLGLAEASFFPGMIVYLTHWFCARDRCRAIACFYIAIPTATLIGSPLAAWLLGVHWWELTGWRWLFFLEGVPAILLGIVTIFYLTDWPSQAHWLPADERTWLIGKLQTELQAKKKIRDHTITQALCDRRVLLLSVASFVAMCGTLGNVYWIPTFLKRLSGFPDRTVTLLLVVPALIGIAGMLANAWHSDNKAERHLHTISPLLVAALMYCLVILASPDSHLAILFLLIGAGTLYAFLPTFWAIPTMIFCESAAAATLGLINSIGQLGGFVGPYLIGVLNDRTHSLTASFTFIALSYVAAAGLILCLRIHGPLQALQVNTSDRITN